MTEVSIYTSDRKTRITKLDIEYKKELDDENSIREKISILLEVPKSFIRVEKKATFQAQKVDTESERYIAFSCQDIIPEKSRDIMVSLIKVKTLFPDVTNSEFCGYFIGKRLDSKIGVTDEDISNLKEISKNLYGSLESIKKSYKKYQKDLKTKYEHYRAYYKKLEAFFKKLPDATFDTIKASLDRVLYLIPIENYIDDEEIFSRIKTSKRIPMAIITEGENKRYFKFSKLASIDPNWADYADREMIDGVYFKISNMNDERLGLEYLKFTTRFSDGYVHNGAATILLNTSFGKDKAHISKIFKGWGIEHTQPLEKSVDGSFEISLPYYDENILVDMMMNDPFIKQYFFCNEVSKSFALKKRNTFYFSPLYEEENTTLGAIPFTISKIQDDRYRIGIRKANSLDHLNVVGSFIYRLLSYLQNEKEVAKYIKKYKAFGIDLKPMKKEKENKPSKRGTYRADLLYDLYKVSVSRKCGPKRQLYTIPDEEVKEYKEKFGDHSVVTFKGKNWVGADDSGEKLSEYGYPGFVFIEESKMCVPCGFKTDQYTKKSSNIDTCMKLESGEEIKEKDKKSGIGYIIETGKDLTFQRYGDTPHLFKKILETIGWERFSKKDFAKNYFKLLRYGMPNSNDTIIHCFEQAVNKERYESQKDKISYVKEIREKMAKKRDLLAACKQSAYDMSLEDLQTILQDEESEIEPEMFIDFLENYYETKAFIIVMNKDKLVGDFFYPRSFDYYIPDSKDKYNKTIIIIKSDYGDGHKCSVIREVSFVKRSLAGPFILEEFDGPYDELKELLYEIYDRAYKTLMVK